MVRSGSDLIMETAALCFNRRNSLIYFVIIFPPFCQDDAEARAHNFSACNGHLCSLQNVKIFLLGHEAHTQTRSIRRYVQLSDDFSMGNAWHVYILLTFNRSFLFCVQFYTT